MTPEYDNIGSPEDRVVEECAELILAIKKAQRFGWMNSHPDRPNSTNLDEVRKEMDDVNRTMGRLEALMIGVRHEFFRESNNASSAIAGNSGSHNRSFSEPDNPLRGVAPDLGLPS